MPVVESLECRRLLALDATFGTGGIATIDLGEVVRMRIADLSTSGDGSIVAVGSAFPTGLTVPEAPTPAGIIRLNPDGTRDTRFGDDGILIDTPGGMSRATSVEQLAGPIEGTFLIYAAGVRPGEGAEPDRVVVSRYTCFGKHDRTFDDRARGSVLVPQLLDVGDMLVLPDAAILLSGTAQNGDAAVLKLAPNGRRDTTFGVNGLTATSAPSTSQARAAGAIDVDDQNRIALGLTTTDSSTSQHTVIVRRYLSNGQVDTGFNGSGSAAMPELTSGGVQDQTLRNLVIDPSDRVNVYYGRAAGDLMRMARLLEDGQLDTGFFGVNGVAAIPDGFTGGEFNSSPARMAAFRETTLFDGPQVFGLFAGGATDAGGTIVPGMISVGSDGTLGSALTMDGVQDSAAILASSPGGMMISASVPLDATQTGMRELNFARFFLDSRPTAMLNIKPPQAGSSAPAQFWVTYRSNTGIDLNSIHSGNLHITMPDGSIRSAHVGKIEPNDDNTEVLVRYKIPAPGGEWDSADNGDYTIRLRSRPDGVRTPANDIFALGQLLGNMQVDL